jgi:predicted DNA-binding transcriptional regulator AlpA
MTKYYTTREIADILKLKQQTLKLWRRKGKGPKFVKIEGKMIRYPSVYFEEWMDGYKNQSIQQPY